MIATLQADAKRNGLRRRRGFAHKVVVAAVALVAGSACVTDSPGADQASVTVASGSNEPITIALIATDLSQLSTQQLAPDLGDPVKVARATVDDLNASGGVNGHPINLTTHVIPAQENFSPDGGRAACLQATQEDNAFAVVIAPAVTFDVARCVAVQNQTLTMTMASWDQGLYHDADGRLFAGGTNFSVGVERSYRAWPAMLQKQKVLDRGTKVGIVSIDIAEQKAGIEDGLKPALAAMGVPVAAEAVLPCDATSGCTQQQAAIQKMKAAGVDVLFLTAPTLLGVNVVQAAADLNYHPRWTTAGQNITNTVAQFFAPVKDTWNGAWGISTAFPDLSTDAEACNQVAVSRAGLHYEKGTDQYSFSAVICLELKILTDGLRGVKDAITQAAAIKSLESMTDVPSGEGPRGSFGPGKHDAGDFLFLSRYDAAKGVFVNVDTNPQRAG
jgi:ABC-type branched-subunit amino acid transport system substrate-binding protein